MYTRYIELLFGYLQLITLADYVILAAALYISFLIRFCPRCLNIFFL